MRAYSALLLLITTLPATTAQPRIPLDVSKRGINFTGIGSLSGGGGVTRFLIDYEPAIQQDILDLLFTPYSGAALQHIKIEMGGDTQSTEGTEATHQRMRGDLNCTRGYEWWIVAEAKKRNPAIKTYGLTWGVPGWIGNGSFYSQDNLDYHVNWVTCAKQSWGFDVDYMGIWNERPQNNQWVKDLRTALDAAGYSHTRLVAADVDWKITSDMLADPALAAAIDIIGAHYPGSAPPANSHALNKPFWASEMWNLGQVNDYNGAMVLASDLSQQARWGLSTSIIWCLIHSWFSILPFSKTDSTNAGAGHALLTASEPWSGHYTLNPTLSVVAHFTQFAAPGWIYLANGTGMGTLPSRGSYVTLFDPSGSDGGILRVSLIIETNAASSPQSATFVLSGVSSTGFNMPTLLHVWQTNATAQFQRLGDVSVNPADGSFTLANIPPHAMLSVTSTSGQSGPKPPRVPIPPTAPFPFPYGDAFDGYAEGAYAKYLSDEGGIFIVEPAPSSFTAPPPPPPSACIDRQVNATSTTTAAAAAAAPGGSALKQVVTIIPIAWETNPAPYTLIGNMNGGQGQSPWTDYSVSISAAIDPSALPPGPPVYVTLQEPCATSSSTQAFTQTPPGGLTTPAGAILHSVAHPGLCLGLLGPSSEYSGATTVGLVNCSGSSGSGGAVRTIDTTTRSISSGARSSSSSSGSADSHNIGRGRGSSTGPLAPVSAPTLVPWSWSASTHEITAPGGLCLDIWSQSTAQGASTVAYPCNGGGNEQWSVGTSTAAPGAVSLVSTLENMCVDFTAGAQASPYVMLATRIHSYTRNGAPPNGYTLYVMQSANATALGSWRLDYAAKNLARGDTPSVIAGGAWHTLQLDAVGATVTARLDGHVLASITDGTDSNFGMVAIGCGWHMAWFDALAIGNVTQQQAGQC